MRYLSLLGLSALGLWSHVALAQDACTTYYKKLYEQGVPTQQINKLKKEIGGLAKPDQQALCEQKMASKS